MQAHIGSWKCKDSYTLDLHAGTTLEVKDWSPAKHATIKINEGFSKKEEKTAHPLKSTVD